MKLFGELKRRNVFRVALFYIVAAWVVIQVAETVLPMFDVADGALRAVVVILVLGFPLAEAPIRKRTMVDRGLPAYWREYGFPPQCRPVVTTRGEDDFECD